LNLLNPSYANGTPEWFAIRRKAGTDGHEMAFWPVPDATYAVQHSWYIPPADLAVDGTDDDTNIRLPQNPLFLGALYLALNERGEEMGEPGGKAEQRYMQALGDSLLNEKSQDIVLGKYYMQRP